MVTVSAPKIPWTQTISRLVTASFRCLKYAGCENVTKVMAIIKTPKKAAANR